MEITEESVQVALAAFMRPIPDEVARKIVSNRQGDEYRMRAALEAVNT